VIDPTAVLIGREDLVRHGACLPREIFDPDPLRPVLADEHHVVAVVRRALPRSAIVWSMHTAPTIGHRWPRTSTSRGSTTPAGSRRRSRPAA
jgi:hypothetical protein